MLYHAILVRVITTLACKPISAITTLFPRFITPKLVPYFCIVIRFVIWKCHHALQNVKIAIWVTASHEYSRWCRIDMACYGSLTLNSPDAYVYLKCKLMNILLFRVWPMWLKGNDTFTFRWNHSTWKMSNACRDLPGRGTCDSRAYSFDNPTI